MWRISGVIDGVLVNALVESLRTDLAFAIAAEEDAVIDVFVGLGNPHWELAGRDGSLTVQHAGVE